MSQAPKPHLSTKERGIVAQPWLSIQTCNVGATQRGMLAAPTDTSTGQPGSSKQGKRVQVTVACEKCCLTHVSLPSAEYSELQRQSADEHDMLHLLRSLAEPDAHRVLHLLRNGEDVATALQYTRRLPTPRADSERLLTEYRSQNLADGNLTSVPDIRDVSVASLALDLNSGRERLGQTVRLSTHETANTSTPALPSFSELTASLVGPAPNVASPPRNDSSLRRSPSAPNLQRIATAGPGSVLRIPAWQHDSRLGRAYAKDWGVSYVADEAFRNIICSYLTWDHQAWRFFDEDDFLEGLVHAPSVSCSRALAHAVIAFGSKNYAWVDSVTAHIAGSNAAAEAERLWASEESNHECLATSAAGLLIWNNNGVLGYDKTGDTYVRRVKKVIEKMDLYDAKSFATPSAKSNRAKPIFVWGVYSWLAFCEFTLGSNYGLSRLPPDLASLLKEKKTADEWIPWPRNDFSTPALTDDVFLTRCSIKVIFMEIITLQKNHGSGALTMDYLNASVAVYHRLRQLWTSACTTFSSLDQATPQLLLLHCWYHYAILQLFRPFTTPSTFPPESSGVPEVPTDFAAYASKSAAQKLRQLLIQGSTMFAGLQAPVIFSQVAVAVALDTLPSPSVSSSASETPSLPSADRTFIVALRVLYSMGRVFVALRLALLGIKQMTTKMHCNVPAGAEDIFSRVQTEISSREAASSMQAGWIVDLNLAGRDLQAARLQNLVRELDSLVVR
ncbi:hypothetical protein Q7P37_010259 [Cladosporium fusiforme]